jgi:glyoxylase-like metal-dependent hydrolase (beta-lactamase superfamily II)
MKQFRFEPLSQASYLVGCARAREGVVVDPIADLGVDFYVLEAADRGLSLVGVLETHIHADFISSALELAEMSGASHYLPAAARGLVSYEFTPLADGEMLDVGKVRLEARHTPGHTPEHTAYVVTDRARADEPWFVLSGDSLFAGDVGRPDLLLGEQALDVMDTHERAATLYRSIVEKLFTLPDHVEVFPNHYGGSTCGGVNMSGKVSTTIGFEKRFNLAMKQPDAEAFAAFVQETAKPFPKDYERVKSFNLGLISKEQLAGAGA